jgi:hypothetical protein
VILTLPAGVASARGDGWQKAMMDPFDWSCGSTTVHVSFPVNNFYFRIHAVGSPLSWIQVPKVYTDVCAERGV